MQTRDGQDVTTRPTICATLLKGMGQGGLDTSTTQYLFELRSVIGEMKKSLDPKAKSAKDVGQTVTVNSSESINIAATDLARQRVENLEDEVTRLVPDQISWSTVTRGKEAVLEKLDDRMKSLKALEAQVRIEERKTLPRLRAASVASVSWAALGAYAWFTISYDSFAALMKGSLFHLSLDIMWFYLMRDVPQQIFETLRQIGVGPVDIGKPSPTLEATYIPFLEKMAEQAASDSPGYAVYSDETNISSDQFRAMKEYNAKSNEMVPATAVAQSVSAAAAKIIDWLSLKKPRIKAMLLSEMGAVKSDPRWARPKVKMEDILYIDSETKEPVLMTFMRFYASEKTPPKKPKKTVKEAKPVIEREATPAFAPVPTK